MTAAPCGSWRSPVTAALVASGGVSFSAVQPGGWRLEGRPLEGGRNVLVHDGTDVTPRGFDVRTRVHEYGGGAFLVSGADVFFVNFADQRVYRQDRGGAPRAITPGGPRFADFRLHAGRLYCVRETHGADGVVNEIVSLPADGSASPTVVATGRDFYSSPRVSPDGSRVAWICWDHPQMPWDGTELWTSALDGSDAQLFAGSATESVVQPVWGPGGLHWISDRTGWWNVYGPSGPVAPMEAEIGGPHWSFGASSYVFLDDGRLALVARSKGFDRLIVGGSVVPLEYTTLGSLRTDGTTLCMVAASATSSPVALSVDPSSGSSTVLARSRPDDPDPAYLSTPEPIEFPTSDGLTAYALWYPPANRDFTGTGLPPLLVFSHGGPTSAATSSLNLTIQFFTSRGLGVVDVNYGGSTGYGRAYRDRLRGAWGVVDVGDCANAARYLASKGLVDPRRMAIRGGSAGGYTTLCALAFTDVFACGASYYGVADAGALARDTHKFEARYLDGLIAPYPSELYEQRSALSNLDGFDCPVIFFQGLDDKVVPPNQAEAMAAALDRKKIPHAYLAFEGEQHGFRKAPTVVRALEAELFFYSRLLGFELADPVEPVEIRHL